MVTWGKILFPYYIIFALTVHIINGNKDWHDPMQGVHANS